MPAHYTKKTRVKIQEYITSGIIESYVLGLASQEEIQQFERLLPLHPELRDALSEFEWQLEAFARDHEIPPPSGILQKIRDQLQDKSVTRHSSHRHKTNDTQAEPDYIHVRTSSPYISVHRSWRPIFIAVFILSKIFLVLFIYYLIKYEHATRDNLQLRQQLTQPATTKPNK